MMSLMRTKIVIIILGESGLENWKMDGHLLQKKKKLQKSL